MLTFYFAPDLSAGSFRATALVRALRAAAPPGTEIDVVTTQPNRYRSYAREAPTTETFEGCEIHRVALPAHQSDMRNRRAPSRTLHAARTAGFGAVAMIWCSRRHHG